MQIFANGKRRFYSFMEFYVIHLKNRGEKFDHSTTLSCSIIIFQLFRLCSSAVQLVVRC